MFDTDVFIKKMEQIIDYYGLSASSFADKIGVQRSSLSHLLSGRNKPSLDFVIKIVNSFPEVDFYWLLEDKGSFPRSNKVKINPETVLKPVLETSKNVDLFSPIEENTVKKEEFTNVNNLNLLASLQKNDAIDKIVIFYNDGTFKDYAPKQP